MELRIFYSWQSDLVNSTNRTFIQSALENAAKRIRQDSTIELAPRVDRDTLGVAGSPDIADTIFEKIRQSHIFVCDISIVNRGSKFRKAPNPNVLIELGYAMMALGQGQIIMAFNTAYGNARDLPFDLQRIRLLPYHLPQNLDEKAQVRKNLERELEQAIRQIADNMDTNIPQPEFKGANLAFQIRFQRSSVSIRGSNWDSYGIDLQITSRNDLSSENGAVRFTLANPMFFSQSVIDIFNVSPEEVVFFSDGREENPNAQTIRATWNVTRGGTIFPGEWFNFFNNRFPVDIPSLVLIEEPVFLIKLELFTTNSPTKTYMLHVRRQLPGVDLIVGELNPQNQEEVMSQFWDTYWKARSIFTNKATAT